MTDLIPLGATFLALVPVCLAINVWSGLRARFANAVQQRADEGGDGLHSILDIPKGSQDHG